MVTPIGSGDGLLFLTVDARVCLLRWSHEANQFVSCVSYGSISSARIPSLYLKLFDNQFPLDRPSLPLSHRPPVFDFLFPTFLPAVTSSPHPILQPNASTVEPQVGNRWMQITSGARQFLDVYTPPYQKQTTSTFRTPDSCSPLMAIATHLNCVFIGKLDHPPSQEALAERLVVLALLHIHKEKRFRLMAHQAFSSDAHCRQFVERLNKHLDRLSLMRQPPDVDRSITNIFTGNSPIERLLRVLAEESTHHNADSEFPRSHELHVDIEMQKGTEEVRSVLENDRQFVCLAVIKKPFCSSPQQCSVL